MLKRENLNRRGGLIQNGDIVRIKNTEKVGAVCDIQKDKSGEIWYTVSCDIGTGKLGYRSELGKDVIELSPEEHMQYKMEV